VRAKINEDRRISLRQISDSLNLSYGTDQEWYASTFRDWVRRHEKCVRVKGEYFEKL
jgi:hypothetical protein